MAAIEITRFDDMSQKEKDRYSDFIRKINRQTESYNRRPKWLNRLLRFLHIF